MSKLSKTEISERNKIIGEGIKRFLDENDLYLTDQNIERTQNHIFVIFEASKSISTSKIHDYLQEALEYQEYNISSLDNPKTRESAEETLMSIITTSNKKALNKSKILLGLFLIVIVLLFLMFQIFYSSPPSLPISTSQKTELKSLVSELVKIDNTNHSKVWNEIKSIDDVTRHGYRSSYSDFNEKQYEAAKEYLGDRLKKSSE